MASTKKKRSSPRAHDDKARSPDERIAIVQALMMRDAWDDAAAARCAADWGVTAKAVASYASRARALVRSQERDAARTRVARESRLERAREVADRNDAERAQRIGRVRGVVRTLADLQDALLLLASQARGLGAAAGGGGSATGPIGQLAAVMDALASCVLIEPAKDAKKRLPLLAASGGLRDPGSLARVGVDAKRLAPFYAEARKANPQLAKSANAAGQTTNTTFGGGVVACLTAAKVVEAGRDGALLARFIAQHPCWRTWPSAAPTSTAQAKRAPRPPFENHRLVASELICMERGTEAAPTAFDRLEAWCRDVALGVADLSEPEGAAIALLRRLGVDRKRAANVVKAALDMRTLRGAQRRG